VNLIDAGDFHPMGKNELLFGKRSPGTAATRRCSA